MALVHHAVRPDAGILGHIIIAGLQYAPTPIVMRVDIINGVMYAMGGDALVAGSRYSQITDHIPIAIDLEQGLSGDFVRDGIRAAVDHRSLARIAGDDNGSV